MTLTESIESIPSLYIRLITTLLAAWNVFWQGVGSSRTLNAFVIGMHDFDSFDAYDASQSNQF